MLRTLRSITSLLAIVAVTHAARADEDFASKPHEGFYLSVAFGPSFVSSAMTTSGNGDIKDVTTGNTDSSQSTSISGMALAGQLLVGGTPSPNLVVGGGSLGNLVLSPTRTWNGNSQSMKHFDLNLLGPFVDYTIVPSIALHVQALVGAADVTENPSGSNTTLWGLGASFGVGAGTWMSRSLCLGLLVRAQIAHLSTSKDGNVFSSSPGNTDLVGLGLNESHTIVSAGLLVELTYH
jgi:hypothetical protein